MISLVSGRPAILRLALLQAALLIVMPASAQGLPPIFASAQEKIAKTRQIAGFKPMTFLENLVVDPAGIVFTSHEDGRIYRATPDGKAEAIANLPGKVAGIAPSDDGYIVTAFDAAGRAALFAVDRSGGLRRTFPAPEAIFLNGIERISGSTYLVADSYKGVIWRFDAASGQLSLWLESELLRRADSNNPTPAANGVRRDGDSVLVSNTQKMLLLRIPLIAGQSAGTPAVVKDRINIDDFAVAEDGSIIAATHIYNNVIRLARDGTVTILAKEGMAGSTSVALSADRSTAYVTTNGGMFLPPPEGVGEAKVVAIELGASR